MEREFWLLLEDTLHRWQQFALEVANEDSDAFHQGLALGFQAAAEELQSLMGQVAQASPSPFTQDLSLEITAAAEPVSSPDWEYFYIGFDQDAAGVWRVKHLNGVWQPNWETGMPLDEAVERMRQRGWKLVRFVKGLHVFKRMNSAAADPK